MARLAAGGVGHTGMVLDRLVVAWQRPRRIVAMMSAGQRRALAFGLVLLTSAVWGGVSSAPSSGTMPLEPVSPQVVARDPGRAAGRLPGGWHRHLQP